MLINLLYLFLFINLINTFIYIYLDILKYQINLKLLCNRFFPCINSHKKYLLYGASCGETKIAKHLLKHLDARIMSNTPTGYQLIKKYPYSSIKPYENIFSMGLLFYYLRPKCIIIAENDIWPVMYCYAKLLQIPIILINFNYDKYSGIRKYIRNRYYNLLSDQIYCINNNKPNFIGNLKLLDTISTKNLEKNNKINKSIVNNYSDSKIFLFASASHLEVYIHKEMIIQLLKIGWKIIYVPRQLNWKPKFEKIFNTIKFTYLDKIEYFDSNISFYVVWKIGLLNKLYQISNYTLMGNTFTKVGGHNIIEPIVNRNFLITGPNYWSQKHLMDIFPHKKIVNNSRELISFLESNIDTDKEVRINYNILIHERNKVNSNLVNFIKYLKEK